MTTAVTPMTSKSPDPQGGGGGVQQNVGKYLRKFLAPLIKKCSSEQITEPQENMKIASAHYVVRNYLL